MMPHIIFLLLIASSPFLALGDETASWGTLSSGPSESECRPYIEKALQGASIHDSPSQTGDTDDVGGTETQEPISQSEVSESESSENPSEGVEEEHQPENSEVNENESSETVEATTAEEKSNEAASGDDGDEETSTENTTGILSDEPTKSEEQVEVAVEGTSDEEETDVRSELSEENEQNSEQHVGAENTGSTEEQTREEGSQEDKVSTEEADTSGDVVDEPGEEASDQRDPSREDIEESKEDNQDTPSQESPEGEESKEVPTEEGSQETPTEEGSQETPAEEGSQEAPDEEGSQEPPAEEGSQEAPAEEGSQETQPEEGRQETQAEGGSQEALAEEESQETPAEEGSQEVPIEDQGEEPQSQEENHEGEEVVESQEEKSDEGASAAEGDDGSGEEASSILNGTGEPASGSAEESETPDEISQETEKSSETADKSEEATDKSTEEGEKHSEETKVESEEANKDEEPSASEGAIESEEVDQVAETTATSEESETAIPGDSSETLPQESEEQKDSKLETESASQEAVVDSDEATKGEDSKETEKSNESEGSGEPSEVTEDEQEKEEPSPEEELSVAIEIPEKLRSREHMAEILRLNAENEEVEKLLGKTMESTLRELKKLYDNAIKPLEILYKYRDLSNRHFGDPEIFSKPLILFMGPWSGGKSTIVNYLLENEYKSTALRTGAEPSPAYFNIVMWGDREEVLDGTQLAADWTFSGLQKFGQGLLDRLRGLRLNHPLLEKVNIVEIPGILEIRKQVERLFPFNDACQWFIDRADIIFLVYDPSKLDVGPETEAILDQLKGREMQTRIILNKADQVKPEELMRVQGTLIWNISPLMSSTEPPVMYSTSLWSIPYESGAPARLLYAQERAFLKDLRDAIDKRVENKIASARRFAVRVRNHAKMVDCYLTTYYNHKSFFGNKKKISDDIIEHPQNYHIYEGLSTLTNISRYDLPDPDVYRDFFRLNPVYEFQQLSSTCTYFRGCPINRLDVAIAYDLPELVGKYKKNVEEVLSSVKKDS